MPPSIVAPSARLSVEPLTQDAFSSFGTVVQNPSRSSASSHSSLEAISANQGSALKYLDVSLVSNHYDFAPSRKPAKAVMNMFVCSPRQLSSRGETKAFEVRILERHPYTPQTFIPVGLAPGSASASYLVIVAPTLPPSKSRDGRSRQSPYPQPVPRPRRSIKDIFAKARPSPFTNTTEPHVAAQSRQREGVAPKGTGQPDLTRLKAFLADGSQAVTYGPGTWHAPMVVLGSSSIDFVVVQHANGVALEDCQEILLEANEGEDGIAVIIDEDHLQGSGSHPGRQVKAKL